MPKRILKDWYRDNLVPVEQKAMNLLRQLSECNLDKDKIDLIVEFAEEVDRDTRHKCAENVLTCEVKCENVGYDLINPGSDHIDIDDAHAVIINTKSI